jgi:hypothetical protein
MSSLSAFDREHVEEIIVRNHGDWFSAQLLRLCAKADSINLEHLRQGFPEHVEAYEDFYYQRGFYRPGRTADV